MSETSDAMATPVGDEGAGCQATETIAVHTRCSLPTDH